MSDFAWQSVNINYGSAFLAGLASFLTPCVLPLVPVYFSYLAGVSVSELHSMAQGRRFKMLWVGLWFILGFSLVFMALGAGATGLGRFLLLNQRIAEIGRAHV